MEYSSSPTAIAEEAMASVCSVDPEKRIQEQSRLDQNVL